MPPLAASTGTFSFSAGVLVPTSQVGAIIKSITEGLGMAGTTDRRDPVVLAVELVERLSGATLPDNTAERLRGEAPFSSSELATIGSAFHHTLASPALTADQRHRLQALLHQVTESHSGLAATLVTLTDGPTAVAPPPSPPSPLRDSPPWTGSTTPRARASTVTVLETGAPRQHRRWIQILTVLVAVTALAATSYLAWTNYRTGQDWRAQAEAARADSERLTTASEALEADLEQVTTSLRRSEADVGLLEERVSRAGDEKARAEDEREMANAYAERITEIALAYDEVAQWFSACRDEQAALTTMVFDFESYYFANQTYLVSNQIDRAADVCGTAERYLSDLRTYVQALGS